VSTDNEPGQPGSAAANQHKTEPMPPTQGHDQPDAASTRPEAPDLGSMNVGANDPQAPHRDSVQKASPVGTPGTDSGPGDAGGVPVVSAYPAEGTSEESAIAQGTRAPQ
jgi:hypothetical protein